MSKIFKGEFYYADPDDSFENIDEFCDECEDEKYFYIRKEYMVI